MDKNDVHAISGRIKNIIAREDMALSPVGKVLVNYYTLALKKLYDFSETLSGPHKEKLENLLITIEDVPMLIIKVANPEEKYETLYQKVMNTRARFKSNEEALAHFTKEYEELAQQYDMLGDEFWMFAEEADGTSVDQREILRLKQAIHMCQYLIEKEKS